MRKSRSTGSIKVQQLSTQENKYQFVNKDHSKYLKCTICKLLFNNPIRLHPCAHSFCEKCYQKKKKCPICEQKVVAVQTDLIASSLINQMTVKCLNDGCPFKQSFEEYKKFHQKNCKLKRGFDEWLKQMKGTLDQNSNNFARHKNQSDEQGLKQKTTVIEPARPLKPLPPIQWLDQLTKKNIKKNEQ